MAFIIEWVRNYFYELEYKNMHLSYIKRQTPNICLWFVQQHGWDLQFVEEQTEEICLEAVKQNGWALQFVREQFLTPKICLRAVEQISSKIEFVKDISYEYSSTISDGMQRVYYVKTSDPKVYFLEKAKQMKEIWRIINPLIRNILSIRTLLSVSISLKQLQLPSYVLMDVIDTVLMKGDVTECIKINKVIQINEQKIDINLL